MWFASNRHLAADHTRLTGPSDYTKVTYGCGHVRYVVKAWCTKYQATFV